MNFIKIRKKIFALKDTTRMWKNKYKEWEEIFVYR